MVKLIIMLGLRLLTSLFISIGVREIASLCFVTMAISCGKVSTFHIMRLSLSKFDQELKKQSRTVNSPALNDSLV